MNEWGLKLGNHSARQSPSTRLLEKNMGQDALQISYLVASYYYSLESVEGRLIPTKGLANVSGKPSRRSDVRDAKGYVGSM